MVKKNYTRKKYKNKGKHNTSSSSSLSSSKKSSSKKGRFCTTKNKRDNLYNVMKTNNDIKKFNISKRLSKTILNYNYGENKNDCISKIITEFIPDLKKRFPNELKRSYIKTTRAIIKKIIDYDNNIPKNINPRSDFYTYVNYNWLKQQEKVTDVRDTYFSKVDSFRVIQDKVYDEILILLFDYIKNNPCPTTTGLKNFCDAFINIDKQDGKYNATQIHQTIEDYLKLDDFELFYAKLATNEIISSCLPIVWGIVANPSDSKVFINSMDFPSSLVLPNYDDYYFYDWDTPADKKRKGEIHSKYLKYLDELFTFYLGKEHGYNLHDIIEVEKDIIDSLGCQDEPKCYKKMVQASEFKSFTITPEQSKEMGFDWEKFTKYLEFEKTPQELITPSVCYFKSIMGKLKKDWKTKWKPFWLFLNLRAINYFSNKSYISFNFNKKYLMGQQVMIENKKFLILGLIPGYNKLLTELYISANPRKDEIQFIKTLSNDLKEIFITIVQYNEKIQPDTKKNALAKLKNLKFVFGTPEDMLDYTGLQYCNDNVWLNMTELSTYRAKIWTKLVGKPVISLSTLDWNNLSLGDTQAYIVNAFYTPSRNDIFIPQAYLQSPFIDLRQRGIEYNLAFIGFTLCHEMSHALDKDGSNYDEYGNLKSWMNPIDKRRYEKFQLGIIKQYEKFASYDGIKFNAALSVGEDIADWVGTVLIVTYLRDFQENNLDALPIRKKSFEAFFTYYAIQGRQTIMRKAIKANLETNPHPLEKYRCNCVLGKLFTFQMLYGVKKGDRMYIPFSQFW